MDRRTDHRRRRAHRRGVDRLRRGCGEEPWLLAELAWWRARAGAIDDVPFELPEPFALLRDGRAREASAAWAAIGRPSSWAALALATGDPSDTAEAVARLLPAWRHRPARRPFGAT